MDDRPSSNSKPDDANHRAAAPETGEGVGTWIARGAGLAIGVAIVVGLLAFAWAAGTVLVLVFVAVILASGLEPIVAWLRTHFPVARGAALLLVYGVFLLSVVGLLVIVLPSAIGQLQKTLAALPPFFDQAREWAGNLRPAPISRSLIAIIDVASRTFRPGTVVPEGDEVIGFGVTVAAAIASVLTLLTVVYFWLTEHARLQRYALAFVPQDRRTRAREIWNQTEARLGMWVRAQLILMAATGALTGIACTVLGVPSAILLGLIAAVAAAVPMVGPLLGAVPVVVVAATVSPQLALIVIVVFVVLQIVEGNVLVPLVMRNTVGISPFLVILSALAGAAAGGLIGALLAVPIAATVEILLEGFQAREVPIAQDPSNASEPDESTSRDDEPASIRSAGESKAPGQSGL